MVLDQEDLEEVEFEEEVEIELQVVEVQPRKLPQTQMTPIQLDEDGVVGKKKLIDFDMIQKVS